MKFLTLTGRTVNKTFFKNRIDYDKKSRSNYQFKLKNFLKPYIKHHVVFEEMPVVGTRMSIDICDITSKIAYEMQGEAHSGFLPFFHKSRSDFLGQIKRDLQKEEWCRINKFTYIEIFPSDLEHLSRQWFIDKYDIDIV